MDFSTISLKGKTALITGGSRGIGRAIALAFAEAGADVAVASRKAPELDEVAEEIKTLGRQSLAVATHVARPGELNNLVDKVMAEFGRVDILVNCAGTNPYPGPLIETEEWAWDATMNVNLKAPFLLSQLAARIMRKQGSGNIINISSVSGIRPGALAIYSVTKAALIMLTKMMAKQWGQYGIRVNAIAPGMIKTRMSEAVWKNPEAAKARAGETALARLGEPEEIARVALFLASDASSFVTGHVIVADGGEIIGPPEKLG
jgi:NAD(P)-dependent dehydrogenase (short-subunit alcohol dehydrogenase family)